MKVLYFDPILGVSGDMILASLIDLGVAEKYLAQKLRFAGDFDLVVKNVNRSGVSAKMCTFEIRMKINENRFIPLVTRSRLPQHIKKTAITIIRRIFAVERKVHHTRHLHLHELADADTLLDIVGALVAIDFLKVEHVYTRSIKAGRGFIQTREGSMPAFNFATAHLLRGFPVEFMPVNAELVTPTGAAILSTIAEPTDDLIFMSYDRVGMGAGSRTIKGYPNVLRTFLGRTTDTIGDECLAIETNIDDMNPQDYEILFERLYQAGALEVFLTPVIMKNSRPGVLLNILCERYDQRIMDILLSDTTTLGIRLRFTKRIKLSRRLLKMSTPYGPIHIKIADHGRAPRFSLEYRDIKSIAQKTGASIIKLREDLLRYVTSRLPGLKR
ncbi:MAG TPA: nickel pincer cofactor biosynthesis protein LarC [bacterium]